MVKLTVMYPNVPGPNFDWEYYLGTHLDLARRLLGPKGLLRIEVDRGSSGFPPGAPAPFYAIAHLFFQTRAELEGALAETAAELIEDQHRYYGAQSVVQVSEVERI